MTHSHRYHKLGEAYRILCEPESRNDDVRQYLADTPSLAWLHALRERKYAKASILTQQVALGPFQPWADDKWDGKVEPETSPPVDKHKK